MSALETVAIDLILVEAALDEAESELVACSEYLDPLIDADGDSESFHPNREMILQAGVHSALRHIESVRRSLELGVSKTVTPTPGLSRAEQAAQANRCGCRGADDMRPCQNVPDRQTQKERNDA